MSVHVRWPKRAARGKLTGIMEKAIIVRGRLTEPNRIDLDEPIDNVIGEIEVVVRSIEPAGTARQDVLDFLRSLPPGTRTKEDIDRQIAEERADWGDR